MRRRYTVCSLSKQEVHMQSLVIQMTGLLLVVPHNSDGSGRMHVLMPETTNLPTHVAWIAFKGDNAKHCVRWAQATGICFVDMDGWSLELGKGAGGTPDASTLVNSPANLTRASGGRRVRRGHFGDEPGRRVRSRITLHAGAITDTCNLASWRYEAGLGSSAPGVTFPLANLVTWTIRDLPQEGLLLTRRRLDRVRGDEAETLEMLHPNSAGVIEMIVIHVPVDEARRLEEAANNTDTTTTARLLRQQDRRAHVNAHTEVATHFNAYYDLLRAKQRPLPHMVGLSSGGSKCLFTVLGLEGRQSLPGLETLNCMVASALSNPRP